MIHTYDEFLEFGKKAGVIAMAGSFLENFPALDKITNPDSWHTDDPKTDPWKWRKMVIEDNEFAYGEILCGKNGFVSKEMYPLFYAAYYNEESIPERYEKGLINPVMLKVYNLFQEGESLATFEIRKEFDKSIPVSKVDTAVKLLQKEFVISLDGSKCKTNQLGEEYGWPSNTYILTEKWGNHFTDLTKLPEKEDAKNQIIEHILNLDLNIDQKKLRKTLFK